MEQLLSLESRRPMWALEVLRYFSQHRDAADTLEGVARWRLLQDDVRRTIDETREAIEWLVAQGYLTEAATPYSERIYSLSKEKSREIEQFLEEEPDDSGESG